VFNYTSDDGNVYPVGIDAGNAAAAGFVASAAGSIPRLPKNYKMRYVLLRHPTTARERKLYCPLATTAAFVGGTTTVTIEDFTTSPSAPVAYIPSGRVGERRLART
jgi:hypothetical protein